MTKNIFSSATIIGILTTVAGTFGVPAIDPSATTTQIILQVIGLLVTLWGRWRQGDLTVLPAKTPVPPVLLVLTALSLAACAAPSAEQGRSAQGGSTGLQPVVNVLVTFGGKVEVSGTSSGTAAPSAASEAQARQDAKQDTSVPIDASGVVPALKASSGALDKAADGLEKVLSKEPKVETLPVEEPVPAPLPPVGG